MKKTIIKSTAIGLFALLMAINITTTINGTTDANLDVSLSGLKALAQSGGEDDGGNEYTCYSTYDDSCGFFEDCWTVYYCGTCTQVEVDWTRDPGTCTP